MSPPEELRFHLASHEIVELLVGNKIYDNPSWVVVRELLQNAVDACRLRRALEPGHAPHITLEYVPAGAGPALLRVTDNGIGMSEDVLRRYFLRVGRSYYSSDDFKARYGEQNFSPIARFGVGVLSCFLVAGTVTVTTHHADAAPISLQIEGLHSLVVARDPGVVPVGTGLVLELLPGLAYDNLVEIARHWARHVEIPLSVTVAGQTVLLPPDDGAAFATELLDPAHYVVLNPLRIGILKTRRISFAGDGISGFFEYPYLESQGRVRRFDSPEGKGIIELYVDRAPQAICLDGVYVSNRLPTALPGFRVPFTAFELNLDSRASGLSLRLDRQQFVDDAAFRRLLARLDTAVLADLIALVQGFDLTEVQFADTLSELLQMRQVARAGSAVAPPVWDALAGLPLFPVRQGGHRRFESWAEFGHHQRLARLPVGAERVVWPGSTEDLADDYWWARQHRLCTSMDPDLPFLTAFDTTELVEAYLEQSCHPGAVVVDRALGTSYRCFAPGAAAVPRLAQMPVLPCTGGSNGLLLTWADGWVLNAGHPLIAALLAAPAGSPAQQAGLKALRALRARLPTLPPPPLAAEALAAAAAALAQATGQAPAACTLPPYDCSEYWDDEWQRFIMEGAGG